MKKNNFGSKTVFIGGGVSLVLLLTVLTFVIFKGKKVSLPTVSPVISPVISPRSSRYSTSSPTSSPSSSNVILNGIYTIQSKFPTAANGGYLGINTLDTANENVWLNAITDEDYIQWNIKPVKENPGTYTIQSMFSKAANGGYLGINKANENSNTVKLDSKTDTTLNQWIITSSTNGSYRIRSSNIKAGSSASGLNGGYLGIDISDKTSNLVYLNTEQAINYNEWYII